jgi:hypothetical protein
VGPTHSMTFVLAEPPQDDLVVEMDVAAALVEKRPEQQVDVFARDNLLTTWKFSLALNRARRRAVLPASACRTTKAGWYELPLTFSPRSVAPLAELDPSREDRRPLGLALHGLRRAS